MKDYKIFLTPQNENWQQAIDRYLSFCEADMKDYFTKRDSYRFINNKAYLFHPESKVPKEYLDEFAKGKNIRIPLSLIELLSGYGTFIIGHGLFEIFNHKVGIMTLEEVLSKYNYLSLLKEIKPAILKSLNQYYFFFGVTFPQTDETSFLFFNKGGNFGKMHIDNLNHDLIQKKVFPAMFNGTVDKYSLDSLISNQIDRVIVNALTVKGYID